MSETRDKLIKDHERHETVDEFDPLVAEKEKLENMPRDILGSLGTAGYSVGHLFNDLCASLWFIYLPYYLQSVVGLSESVSAGAQLSG